jgi:hypothetical protein
VDHVAANMCRKQLPLTYLALDQNQSPINSYGKTGLEEVYRVGLGMCLIRLDVLKNIPAPLFEVKWLPEHNTYQGEDVYLCNALRNKGIKLYVDHTASNLVGHIGDYSYEFPKN